MTSRQSIGHQELSGSARREKRAENRLLAVAREYAPHVLIFLVCLTGALGGGSREDIASLPYLRAIAGIAIAIACLLITRRELSTIKWPLALLALLGVIGLVQLIPLPLSAIAHDQGPRASLQQLDQLLGLSLWRPVTLSPAATINALGSLLVPLAALLWLTISGGRRLVLIALLGVGVVSAGLGLLQLFADPRSGLFFYDVTNAGSPVGLFANRNHAAVFLACCLAIAVFLHRGTRDGLKRTLPFVAVFLGVCALVNPSRAGLLALGLALLASGLLLRPARTSVHRTGGRFRWALPLAGACVCAVFITVFAAADRIPALSRIVENPSLTDLRSELNPISWRMLQDLQPWGSGLGTYEHIYRFYEPIRLLMPSYVNEAHNDWVQFPIETGAIGVLVVLIALCLGAYRLVRLTSSAERGEATQFAWLGGTVLLILAVASLVDYPLRVPMVQVLAIVALAFFSGFHDDDDIASPIKA